MKLLQPLECITKHIPVHMHEQFRWSDSEEGLGTYSSCVSEEEIGPNRFGPAFMRRTFLNFTCLGQYLGELQRCPNQGIAFK